MLYNDIVAAGQVLGLTKHDLGWLSAKALLGTGSWSRLEDRNFSLAMMGIVLVFLNFFLCSF